MEYLVETGIAIPDEGRTGKAKYPFGHMNVGDSFAFDRRKRDTIVSSMRKWSARLGTKYTARTLADGTCRIWRVS